MAAWRKDQAKPGASTATRNELRGFAECLRLDRGSRGSCAGKNAKAQTATNHRGTPPPHLILNRLRNLDQAGGTRSRMKLDSFGTRYRRESFEIPR
jgi:hypothetical protein